ncbi:MAG: LPP20 family lipoprotein, partial [Cyclobacteriaceae bacterium]
MLLRILVLIILFLSACSPKVATVQSPPKPEWLKQKPVSNTYYYGIGQALKDGKTNHLSAAKNSALEDLISEIRVTVSATSALSILDAGKEFTEKYEQIIRTSVADDIEDFELAGSWEDENNYWVWYRLSKQRYQEIKENRKQAAASLALDFYSKAKKSEQEGNIALSIGFYLKALHALEKYLNEPVRVNAEGKE